MNTTLETPDTTTETTVTPEVAETTPDGVITGKAAKNSLKFSAEPTEKLLTVIIDGKSYTVPGTVRLLTNATDKTEDADAKPATLAYIGISAFSALVALDADAGTMSAFADDADATNAYDELAPEKASSRKSAPDAPAIPAELAALLADYNKTLGNGFKMEVGPDGPRVIRTRTRKDKGTEGTPEPATEGKGRRKPELTTAGK